MTLAALIFEGLVAALLLVAVVMCWRVDRRLNALKRGQDGGLAEELQLMTGHADRAADTISRRPQRRRASEIFPEGAGSSVINGLKDVR